MKILLAEDDVQLSNCIRQSLMEEGHLVDVVRDGEQAWLMCSDHDYDLLILDIMMPKYSGLEVLRLIRQAKHTEPVLLLTARDRIEDKVEGLDIGADDYMTKPFSLSELKARVRALGRRKDTLLQPILSCGDITLNQQTHCAFRGDREIHLTIKEFALLEYLLRNKGSVVTRTEILERVWGVNIDTYSDVVKVMVSRIRKKMENAGETPLINSVRGVGYIMKEPIHES